MVSSERVGSVAAECSRQITDRSRRIPVIGKNPPYVATFAIFVLLTIPSALTDSFAGLLVLRFLLGFFGKPSARS